MLKAYIASLLRPRILLVLLVLAAASWALWTFGAGLTFDGSAPFADGSVRAGAIAGILVLFLLVTFVRHALLRRANARLIRALMANDELAPVGNDMSPDEIELVRERFEATLRLLRKRPIRTRRGRKYLLELPLYVVIGPPGAGKTTLLQNSGLEFPLAADEYPAMPGMGGTRNCDWWISSDAVLIDTAGRDASRKADRGGEAAAWGDFLQVLKQHRRQQPLNGVVLAISIAEVALSDDQERQRWAEALRQRLRELHRAFGVRLPVYLVFTKCDLVAGFEEFFGDAGDSERQQTWGVAFPEDEEQMGLGAVFEAGFLDLVARLERRLAMKLAVERHSARRCRIYTFPHEFGSLASVLRGFVSDVFRASRNEAQPMARGVYFTSGTQEGIPFDRLLYAMSRSFPLRPRRQAALGGAGKAFFVQRLLADVVFPEQGLVGSGKGGKRNPLAYVAGYAAVAAIVLGVGGFWLHGLGTSFSQVERARAMSAQLGKQLAAVGREGSLTKLLPVLDAARRLNEAAGTPSGGSPTGMPGIDARGQLSAAAGEAYDAVLKGYLLPAMASQIATRLRSLSGGNDTDTARLRDELATYLMLTKGENFDRGKVEQALRGLADATFTQSPDDRERMEGHVDRLAVLLPAATTADEALIAQARALLGRAPQASNVYDRIVREAQQSGGPSPIVVSDLVGSGVLRSDGGQSDRIPGLYTRNGFESVFLRRLSEITGKAGGSDWVMGSEAASDQAGAEAARQVAELYARDYVAAWRGALSHVQVIDFDTLDGCQRVLQALASPQSPLVRLLSVLRDNTRLAAPSTDDTGSAQGGASAGAAAANAISAAFQPLTALADANTPGSLDRTGQLLKTLSDAISAVATDAAPRNAAYDLVSRGVRKPSSDSFAELRAEAATKPEPVSSIVSFVADRSRQIVMEESHAYLNALWQQHVLPACTAAVSGHYPFSPSSSEDLSLKEFSNIFGPNGMIEKFVSGYLGPFVTTKGRQIVETAADGDGLGLSSEALAQFTRAQMIRDAAFGEAVSPSVNFTIQPTYLDPKALRATFRLDDKRMAYRHGPIRGQAFTWPGKLDTGVAEFSVTLLDGSTQTIQEKGPWAMFRLLAASGLSKAVGQDQFIFSVEKDQVRASFSLLADSVVNPFNLGLYPAFRCPSEI